MEFVPKDPNFADRVRASFARQRMMQTFGVEIVNLKPGMVELFKTNLIAPAKGEHLGIADCKGLPRLQDVRSEDNDREGIRE